MTELTGSQREKLMADLKVVVSDAEELLKLTAGEVSESSRGLRERMQDRLNDARSNLVALQATATRKAKEAGHVADEYVHENPWRAVAAGAGVGLVVGLLIGRR
jgi:ElaB/YqjD/DUF883 family membrane-anchored ribosome-binding protein